jgi:hypothetical protein
MKLKPGVWIAIAQLLTVINVGAVGFTVWSDWLRARVRGA